MSLGKFFLVLFLLGFCLTGSAETVRFRSGVLLAAELSTKPPRMAEIDLHFPKLPANRIYAVIVLKLDPGRKISVYDYSIKAFGRIFPCVAIWKNGRFEFDEGDFDDSRTALLFVLDQSQIGLNREERLILRSCCPPEKLAEQEIRFRVLEEKPLPDVKKIPEKGQMAVK